MLRSTLLVSALVAGVLGTVHAQDRKGTDRLHELKSEFRKLEGRQPGIGENIERRRAILKEIAALNDPAALQFLVDVARNGRYVDFHAEALQVLAEKGLELGPVAVLFQELMVEGGPHRLLARGYLLARAVARQDDSFLASLFVKGDIEDRFLALQAMGKIGSLATLAAAQRLLGDAEWKPKEGSVICCATIASSLRRAEGAPAAQALLLMQRDPRFLPSDAFAVREATRLWSRRDLHAYVELKSLADPDTGKRVEAARFMGNAGIEAARAPLLIMARDKTEHPSVRAAAAEALGGLRIARGDLASRLEWLLDDPDAEVHRGVLRGLARLGVRQSAEILVDLLQGPQAADARAALARAPAPPPDENWPAWLATLPEGT